MAETAVPPGYQPLFIATATCEIFNLRTGTDVTADSPMKIISKSSLLADIETRRAVSDFQPFKAVIATYPKEELLIFFDAEWRYGQNFYMITTVDVADMILNPPKQVLANGQDGEQKHGVTDAVKKLRGPWVSLGSEKEVDAEMVKKSRPSIAMQISKNKSEFCKPLVLNDHLADENFCEHKPPPDAHISELKRHEVNIGIQAISTVCEKFIQATSGYPKNAAVQYEPIIYSEAEKREIIALDSFQEFIRKIYDRFEYALMENEVIDIFKNQYSELVDEDFAFEENNRTALQEYQSFTELKYSKNKSISWIEWHPTLKSVVAVACTSKATFDEKIEARLNAHAKRSLIIFWSFSDPIHPQLFLDAPDDVQCFSFNPTNPDIIVGGCSNGQLVVWNISEHQERLRNSNKLMETQGIKLKADGFFATKTNETPFVQYVAASCIESGHRSMITDIIWTPPMLELNNKGGIFPNSDKDKVNLISSSLDGHLFFWELRNIKNWESFDLTWKPLLKSSTNSADGTHDYGCTRISLRMTTNHSDSQSDINVENLSLTTKFFGGCDDGDIIYADWYSEKLDDKGVKMESIIHGHFGSVTNVERSPFFPDLILTVGGWSFHILKEGPSIGTLLSSEHYLTEITSGKWSRTRPGVFFIGRSDGVLEIWDLLDKSNAPAAIQTISSNPISCLSLLPGNGRIRRQLMAIGDDNGTLFIMEIPRSLTKAIKNEKSIMTSFFEREVKRLGSAQQSSAKTKGKLGGSKIEQKDTTQNRDASSTEDTQTEKKDRVADTLQEFDSFEKYFSLIEKTIIDETLKELTTNLETGLSVGEVDFRRAKYGSNEMDTEQEETLADKFLDQLKQPLILLLFGSALVSAFLNQIDNANEHMKAILIVVLVAFVQEYRSEKSLEALNKLVPHYSHVIRDGRLMTTLGQELVPGDVVSFSTGDRIPADIRIVKCVELEIDESNLSGETKPRKKTTSPMVSHLNFNVTVPLIERDNIAFMGTLVRAGNGIGVVVATGKETEFGAIWTLMKCVETKRTPLQIKMEELGKHLSIMSFGVILMISIIGLIQRKPVLETFTIAVSLAVAAIPEGLPIVVTVTLALGVLRMTKRQAIVKRLPTVESLGSVNVICADKTGTLTSNRMTVSHAYFASDLIIDISTWNNLNGRIQKMLHKVIDIGTFCNNAKLAGNEWSGQPTEIALHQLSHRLNYSVDIGKFFRVEEIPFDSESKWMCVKYDMGNSSSYFAKGAPEVILEKCNQYHDVLSKNFSREKLGLDIKKDILSSAVKMSTMGLRVLAFAYGDRIGDLVFVGLLGMLDPPRDGVANAIYEMNSNGIRVLMITGDAYGTALSMSKSLGIVNEGQNSINLFPEKLEYPGAMSGIEIERLSPKELQEAVNNINVFYRTSPKHKLEIVKALQAKNAIVAMTGDGVNDAPALKLADIGIAMGKSGTDVSREAADMILVDDNFCTILSAIEEGKTIFYNIQNFLRFQLSTSIAALILISVSTLCGWPTPLNPMQILWINIIMDGPPAQSLGVEPVDHEITQCSPRPKGAPIINRKLIFRVLLSAGIIVTGTLLVYRSEMSDNVVTSRDTTMTFTTFVLFDMFNALSCRSEKRSIFSLGLFTNRPLIFSICASIFCQLLVIYSTFFQRIFQTEALSFNDIISLLLISSSVLVVDELRKFYSYYPWQFLWPRLFLVRRPRQPE